MASRTKKTYRARPRRAEWYVAIAAVAIVLAAVELLLGSWTSRICALLLLGNAAMFWQLSSQRRHHPVVKIDGQILTHYPPVGEPVSIPIHDLVGVAWDSGTGHIGVGLQSNETIGLDVRDLSSRQRAALKEHIQEIADRKPAA